MKNSASFMLAVFLTIQVTPSPCVAEPKPLWEVGLGVGSVLFSDYPGAATSHGYVLPVPYFRYRGQFLRSDDEGMRGVLLDRPEVTFKVSLGASVPVKSKSDAARSGMPNLDGTIEAGPSMDWHLWHSESRTVVVDFRVPVRLAVTVDSRPQAIGWFVAPNINIDIRNAPALGGGHLGLLVGPLYSARRYNDYYYSVAARYATNTRPEYQAPGGYAGAEAIAAFSKRFPRFWVGAFVRYRTMTGAVFADSPLVKRTEDIAAGVGVAWMISSSAQLVDADQ